MKKILATVVAGSLLLASCAGVPTSTTITTDITALVAAVKADAQAVCGFIINPTAANIATIVSQLTNTPNAEAVATMICNAAQSLLSRRYGATSSITFKVNGLPISGHF